MTFGSDFWLEMGIGDWDGGGIGEDLGIGNWDWGLGLGIGIGDLDWGWGLGIRIGDWLCLLAVCDF